MMGICCAEVCGMGERGRPIAVTVVSWLAIAAGVFGLARGFLGARTLWPFPMDLIWIVLLDVTWIVCGVYLLRGRNWARWLTLVWMAIHVGIVLLYWPQTILAHVVIFAMIGYMLMLRGDLREYFRAEAVD